MARHRHRVVVIPPTTQNTIVFPFNFSTRQFVKQHYFPMMTNDKLGTDELNQFLAEIESQIQVWYVSSGLHRMKLFLLIFALLGLATVIAIPVGTATQTTSKKGEYSFPVVIPVMMGLLFGYLIFFVIMAIRINRRSTQMLQEVSANVKRYINQREDSFRSRGLLWVLPLRFPYWIELWKQDGQNLVTLNPGLESNMMPMNNSFNMQNTTGYTVQPGMMMQPQMQPMQMQMQMQQQTGSGMYTQNIYGDNTYNSAGVYA